MDKDKIVRQEALDPTRSFIVQAPAGSGKTELLTQRFLQLLCYTRKAPEEVIAITFTRKAAGEMRERIVSALTMAERDKAPDEPHRKATWTLAKNVLKRDKELGWNLQSNPNRLRIFTIDALAAHITQQIPLHAKLSPQLNLTENPRPYYQQAVQELILSITDKSPWENAIHTLLKHLDNNVYQLESLLIHILQKREQWLPYIIGQQDNTKTLKQQMELGLKHIVIEKMQTIRHLITDDIACELLPLAHYAGLYCQNYDSENPIAACHTLQTVPDTAPESLTVWQGIATLLLTQKGEWRKAITKRQGFPAKDPDTGKTAETKIIKQQLKELLNSLRENDVLRESLYEVMQCPPLHYSPQQWKIIEALIKLLPVLAAGLNLIFKENGNSDFIELNLATHRALGEPENPTDLALYLDHQITHLLVDEFQDTSVIQFRLIEKLLSGWEAKDGRTVFLVGDPMQSIYRFRNAEVGLFLRTQEQGIAGLSLDTLRLEKNFRSTPAIVDWTNASFHNIFPKQGDIASGAIQYAPAIAAISGLEGEIKWKALLNDDGTEEANTIIQIVREKRKKTPDNTIAILVRSRNQLAEITASLHENKIPFKAIDIEPLNDRIEIQDVHTITRVLLHRADRVAWLALLRAPYCGLTLKDLHAIVQATQHNTLWQCLKNYNALDMLSPDAKGRLDRFFPSLYYAIENNYRQPLSQSVKGLWLALGGPAVLENTTQLSNVESYFKLLENLEQDEPSLSLSTIEEKLNRLYAEPNADADDSLQIMTIHKAKGLEFDHVILPGLNRKTPYDPYQLLMWLERPNALGSSDLILAPIKSASESQDLIYRYLRHVEKTKGDNETARLLYVATTRAKKSLDFIASINTEEENPEQLMPPKKGSFLELLWETAEDTFSCEKQRAHPNTLLPDDKTTETYEAQPLRRLTSNWALPITPGNIVEKQITKTEPTRILLEDKTPRILGTVVHECLQKISEDHGIWTKEIIEKQKPHWQIRLTQLGMQANALERSIDIITNAITKTINDPRGCWILSNKHQDAHSEYALSGIIDQETINIIIDRCFIDAKGTRWIIDYKTSIPTDSNLTEFLQNQKERYQTQLERYAALLQKMEARTIKLALYFPLCTAWTEWTFASEAVIV